jgi:hypothetical protein
MGTAYTKPDLVRPDVKEEAIADLFPPIVNAKRA